MNVRLHSQNWKRWRETKKNGGKNGNEKGWPFANSNQFSETSKHCLELFKWMRLKRQGWSMVERTNNCQIKREVIICENRPIFQHQHPQRLWMFKSIYRENVAWKWAKTHQHLRYTAIQNRENWKVSKRDPFCETPQGRSVAIWKKCCSYKFENRRKNQQLWKKWDFIVCDNSSSFLHRRLTGCNCLNQPILKTKPGHTGTKPNAWPTSLAKKKTFKFLKNQSVGRKYTTASCDHTKVRLDGPNWPWWKET